ncbi:Lrp/AsnC family transcriptional regulator [Actinoplanes sp. M2I2]|uniref:Lrp/AsnC family transcriptional regulator n=1 Tax=Actinoplanes sp. M2I2 TaxID=1734444 RepID=UPI0035B2108B
MYVREGFPEAGCPGGTASDEEGVRQVAGALDDIDRRILAELTRDGRLSMRTLAERLHISRANAYARVERLRATGVIRGYRADVDPVAAGLGTTAYVTVNLNQAEWRDVAERLSSLPGVVHIALVGGEFDVIMLVRAEDNAALGRLVLDEIQGMPGVVNTRTLLVFEEAEPARPGE